MALAWAAHHWKYCFREQRSLVTFAYNCAHIVPRNLVNRVVGAHFSFIVLKQRNHEVKLPLARPHCPAMAGRRRAAGPAGVVPNTVPRWQAQKWSDPSRYAQSKLFRSFFARVKIVASRIKTLQNFRVFREWRASLRKTSIISGTMIDRTNSKTAFEREFNYPSQHCRQI